MKITGAILEEVGRPGPWRTTRPLRIAELDLDGPGPHEILVRIEVAGLCHSDLSVVDGNRPRPVPMVLGHEAAGIVEEVGGAVTGLTVGQRVIMTFLPRCGQCPACQTQGIIPCEPGTASNIAGTLMDGSTRLSVDGRLVNHHLGVSGFATHAVVDSRSVVPVAADVPAEVAALLGCAVLTGGGAVLNVGKPLPGETVAVVGLGGVGMASLLTALGEPGVEVMCIDVLEDKLEHALSLGAHHAFTPDQALQERLRAQVVIEAAGSVKAFETAMQVGAPGSRLVCVGLPHPDARASISPLTLVAEGRTVVGSYLGSAVPERDIPTFVDRWRNGILPVERLVSGRIDITDINEAMDDLAAGRAVRQILTFRSDSNDTSRLRSGSRR